MTPAVESSVPARPGSQMRRHVVLCWSTWRLVSAVSTRDGWITEKATHELSGMVDWAVCWHPLRAKVAIKSIINLGIGELPYFFPNLI